MTDPSLDDLIVLWHTAVSDFRAFAADITDDQWHHATDLAGWDVAAVVAHIAHLEHVVAGGGHEPVDIGAPEHVKNVLGEYTEQGVVARRGRTRDELVTEIDEARVTRAASLAAAPPDPDATAPDVFGLLGWTNDTLLRNRIGDIWMHEQDLRRTLQRPGNLDGAVGTFVIKHYLRALGYALGKGAKAAIGQSARVDVGDITATAVIGEDGRGRAAEVPGPTTTISLSREAYIVLAGGRVPLDRVEVSFEGDGDLATRLLNALTVTP
ncbi:hypothetical protein Back2_09840 [Nocardioides baekrokdamisoli]|uniref:Mycothiol-dependent maleylpyruvate isomerase metal-binding domain-containing protein n=1 Tax=Nocardioides baekrokdamisoli TaxID=1804624 RepID=A0A3G9ICN3_9ACTN|nr:maleylpyruvate isomerase family mycothiol-dependent enzyme [Nocardioides baekrokdamisoli]BBH16697.1 hypothetical protein Back2_09840 [Nocardioides baekrokdamisoli]